MLEELLEDIAQKNGLREVNTNLKLIAGIGAIILCLISGSFIPPLFIAILLGGAVIYLARVDMKTYAELFILPLMFAFMSIAGIILIRGGTEIFWQWEGIEGFAVSITRESINEGFLVFCRVLGGISALCFLSLTTPMTDIFNAFRQFRIPDEVIDLMMIIYRTIFILMDQVIQIYHAQVMRLGYSRYRESIRSFALLCGAAFIASWDAGDDLVRAMDARCYSGKFAAFGESRPAEPVQVFVVVSFLALSSAVVIISGSVTLI
ncbi:MULTISPECIES: cobalt ECF transporter T component CbiQ [unclassified Methanoregula]|uniref:cobalt ECF transporter T component CbiQ n=1 Tax=unclassified Methanoregula TaxID=2649730 RepID=UPI0009C9C370|nr:MULTISPECIES: cobalt ECF transporter T component CbiQ [unclassified Methanoregula]OPX65010.1 MAG: Energy-coupling factor transporter transmembrane protein EcfT [Methanoregula sp. PtaB.Bin085]OPY32386.1 MAG: Energy-coupling factor transporter transmembrane protein EcfT [Methanoregula sp. PtaU1.Bin006]